VNFYVKSHAPADLKRLYLDNSLSYIYNHTTTNQNYPGTESVITAKYDIGIDIGSVSVNTVVMDGDDAIVEERYDYCHGKPFHVLDGVLEELIRKYGDEGMGYVALTGTGGTLGSELLGGLFVNEIVAQSSSVARLYPRIRTIIEMGGEDSKLIFMEGSGSAVQLEDFAMNSICAAGTGSFLDQQAKRIGVSIEKEFGELAMKSENPPRIAGRCSVFAKSDMIHLQQIATPVHDIVAGLCFAVARNFKSSLAQGKKLTPPVSFQGGVAGNGGMVRAFREVFELDNDGLVIPEHHASMGAIGALFHLRSLLKGGGPVDEEACRFRGLDGLKDYLREGASEGESLSTLKMRCVPGGKEILDRTGMPNPLDVYLGLDVGSLSTNVVLIDDNNSVVARRYLPTASRPLEAIRRGLSEILEEVGDTVRVRAAGTTGSGRYLTGDFIGADTIQNEITAQATAAIAYDRTVDTIFEIGGQDSKFISIDDGVVVDFEMNKVCAAGTGSFLEEQAEKLDIEITRFGDIALSAEAPAKLGDRCTVFMESDLNAHQQRGVQKDNLVSGLAYSIVYNYIQKVVGNKRIGNRIFFQGGVTNNKSVVAAFEQVTGRDITVPPHFDVTGAIGAAILARNRVAGGKTRFKGFDVSTTPYSIDRFTCKGCSNQCEIRRVTIEGEKRPLFYGGRCEKYEIDERKGKGAGILDLFEERLRMLMGPYYEPAEKADTYPADREPEKAKSGKKRKNAKVSESKRTKIGIPRGLMVFYQHFPFWRTFFEKLGFDVVLSNPTNRKMVTRSLEQLHAETCFPAEVMHGHVFDLLETDADYVFLPSVVNAKAEKKNPTKNYNCPWIQTLPFMVRAALSGTGREDRLLIPVLHFKYFGGIRGGYLERAMSDFMEKKFSIPRSHTAEALKAADEEQAAFERRVEARGREVLADLPAGKRAVVMLGRPYNTCDPELNLSLAKKLKDLDVIPIPIDYLPLSGEDVFDDYPMMYWPNGRRILKAARIVKKDERLHAVYLGNFRCGPDSFLQHFIREEMRGKPYLQLEVDEHSADAGMITRLEAFLDSLPSGPVRSGGAGNGEQFVYWTGHMRRHMDRERTLYIPYVCDHVHVLAASSRHFDVDAQVLPYQDERTLELGRRYTSSKECFPLICTTGDFLKKILEPGFVPERSSFFMPDHNGPCRFGHYNRLQRIIFDRLGYTDVQIISPGNDNSYEDLSRGHGNKFRILVWKGFVVVDMLRKMLQERRPYEKNAGECERTYDHALKRTIECVQAGARDIGDVLVEGLEAFKRIPVVPGPRRPVISITGEVFMRDNPHANGDVARKVEDLGGEIIVTPVREWVIYSTYRYWRDSVWARDLLGMLKAKIQELYQNRVERSLVRLVEGEVDLHRDIHLKDALDLCMPYVDKHYDGQPALVLGGSQGQVATGISGVVNIMPFTCMPETFTTAVTPLFRKRNDNVPWVNISYDGQGDMSIDTKLQAFMYQAHEYARRKELGTPRNSG